VIADLHGKFIALKSILNRILPLRKNDKLIFLGDYIDRGNQSPEILDELIELKKKFNDNIIFLMGNHEWLFLNALDRSKLKIEISKPDLVWLHNGGYETIESYERYLKEKGLYKKDFKKLKGYIPYIPEPHIEFLSGLSLYYEDEDYIFVHAGCDPNIELHEQSPQLFLWDRTLYAYCSTGMVNNSLWKKTVICGHSSQGPLITEKYIMLDASAYEKVCCLELNSMECFTTENKEKRMLRHIY
jgi:serine/threonine protein phosphatase 1